MSRLISLEDFIGGTPHEMMKSTHISAMPHGKYVSSSNLQKEKVYRKVVQLIDLIGDSRSFDAFLISGGD